MKPTLHRAALVLSGVLAASVGTIYPTAARAQAGNQQAIRLSSEDEIHWRREAQDRFVVGDIREALKAWNLLGEPKLERIDVVSQGRTREGVIIGLIGLQPDRLLTPDAFVRAAKRLEDLPVASEAQLQYVPVDGGRARLEARVDEHHLLPTSPFSLAAILGRAIVNREIRIDVAGPTGNGENVGLTYRRQSGWKRAGVNVAVPAPGPLPGLLVFDVFAEDQAYLLAPGPELREKRRHVGLSLTDWATGMLRWEAGGAWDRFGDRPYAGFDGAVEARLFGDHLSFGAAGTGWGPLESGDAFGVGRAAFVARTTTTPEVPVIMVTIGATAATDAAPLAVWPGAGSTQARDGLLRAHSLRRTGRVVGEAVGRSLTYGSLEYERVVRRTAMGPVFAAFFVDTARASRRFGDLPATPWLVDVGVGARMSAGGSGLIRLDVARNMRAGGWKASVGFIQKWPRR